MLLVYTNSDALLDLVNNVREDVVELFLDAMRDAAPDRTAVEQYLIKTNFQWPASAPKRRAQPKDYWDLMMIDPERLKPAILKQLKAAGIEESVKDKIAEDVYADV